MTENSQTLDVIKNFVLRRSSIIEASAGTGKTFNITYMVLRLLLGPTGNNDKSSLNEALNIENILVVTFTNSATAELRDRIRDKIRTIRIILEKLSIAPIKKSLLPNEIAEEQLIDLIGSYLPKQDRDVLKSLSENKYNLKDEKLLSNDARIICKRKSRILIKAERNIDTASIRTIHSFCNSVVNQIYAFESGEPFSIELNNDTTQQYHKACSYIFRKLFYTNSNAKLLLSIVDTPKDELFKNTINSLKKVRLIGDNKLKEPLVNLHGYALNLGFDTKRALVSDSEKNLISDTKKPLVSKPKLLTQLLSKNNSLDKKLDLLLSHIKEKQSKAKYIASDQLKIWMSNYKDCVLSAKPNSINLYGTEYKLNKDPFEQLKKIAENCDNFEKLDNFYDKVFKKTENPLHSLDNFMRKNSKEENNEEFIKFKIASKNLSQCFAQAYEATEYKNLIMILISMMIIDKTDEICTKEQVMSNDEVLYKLAKALRQDKSGKNLAEAIRRRYRVAIIDEFQDTDPVQLDIFRNIYLNDNYVKSIKKNPQKGSYCYIIGDPKQSIYAFRNADINSYIKAKKLIKDIAQEENAVYSLKKNFRSAPDIIEGVNAIFSQSDNPFDTDPEDVSFVKASGVIGKKAFFFENDKQFKSSNFVTTFNLKDGEKDSEIQAALAALAAKNIYQCLKHGVLTNDPQDKLQLSAKEHRPNVKADDITVLVANANEYKAIAKALAQYNIPCVYYSEKTSVLKNDSNKHNATPSKSKEVTNIFYLMEAILDCFNRDKIYRLLGSALLKQDSQEFIQSLQDEVIEEEVRLLQECYKLWERWGFLTAFLKWFKDPLHQGLKRFLSLKGGERELTNYLHIAEIVQDLHAKIHGANAQMQHFRQLVDDDIQQNRASDLTQKRLESETRQIKVYTIHKSKGLEFPIVFMPFLWGEKKQNSKGPAVYYDKDNKIRGYSLDGVEEIVNKAAMQEDARLLYVALTRAVAANFIYLGLSNEKNSKNQTLRSLNKLVKDASPQGKLLSTEYNLGDQKIPLFENITDKEFSNISLPKTEEKSSIEATAPLQEFAPSTLKDKIKYDFIISSYSEIVSGLYGHDPKDDFENEIYCEASDTDKRFVFPKGTAAGSFLHEMLQNCAFEQILDENYRKNFVLECLNNDYRAITANWKLSDDKGQLLKLQQDNLSSWLYNIVKANLKSAVNSDNDFSLSSLNKGQYIPEMEFLIPVDSINTYNDLNSICIEYAKLEKVDYQNMVLADEKKDTRLVGYLTGSIDLVFCHKNRFYVVDYKSNYLGCNPNCYSLKALSDNISSPYHRYDMQYLIYSVALQRFLKSRLGEKYDYEQHFGGVIYLYLRGLYDHEYEKYHEYKDFGIFSTRPPINIIDAFEKLLCEDLHE